MDVDHIVFRINREKGCFTCFTYSMSFTLQILEESFLDSTTTTPIYFILSPGANVVGDLDKLAEKYGFEKNNSYHNVSMGQGQVRQPDSRG